MLSHLPLPLPFPSPLQDLSLPMLLFIIGVKALGYYIFRGSNGQKDAFRYECEGEGGGGALGRRGGGEGAVGVEHEANGRGGGGITHHSPYF